MLPVVSVHECVCTSIARCCPFHFTNVIYYVVYFIRRQCDRPSVPPLTDALRHTVLDGFFKALSKLATFNTGEYRGQASGG